MDPLEILFQCERLVAINKPNGLLVHRSPIASDADVFAVRRGEGHYTVTTISVAARNTPAAQS